MTTITHRLTKIAIALCLIGGIMSCNDSEHQTSIVNKETDAFYRSHFLNELKKAGVDLRAVQMDTSVTLTFKSNEHSQILEELDEKVNYIKEVHQRIVESDIEIVDQLLETVTEMGIQEKEEVYQKLLIAKTDADKSFIYQQELLKVMKAMDSVSKIAGIEKDIRKLLALTRRFSYLDVIERDENGNIPLSGKNTGNSKTLVRTVQKYDELYHKRQWETIMDRKNQKDAGNDVGHQSILGIPIY